MRAQPLILTLIAAVAVTLAAAGCGGEPGPPGPAGPAGPPGPAGTAATVDEAAIEAIVERVLAQQENSLGEARRLDSQRLDNLIHGIIERTQDPEFKARLAGLDREIHRVFEAAAAAAADPEAARTMKLMERIVVLASIMDAIAEARLAQGNGLVPPTPDSEAGSELPAASVSLPGDPYEFGPAAGDTLAVVGVAWDEILDVRDVPGGEIVARLDPWGKVVATGNTRKVSTAVWHEVRIGELTGWAGADFLAPLGWSRDMASQVVERVGETPMAETLLDLGLIVAGFFVSEGEVSPRVVFSGRPAHAEALSQVAVDVLGLPDDSVRGYRIVVSADAVHEQGFGTGPFAIWSVSVTDICYSSRGVSEEGLCV